MGVKPRHVARRNLQIDDPQRTTLEHLTMVWLLMHRHDGRLPLSGLIRRLPGRGLAMHADGGGEQPCGDTRDRHEHT
jgi:hypothetical protein